FHEWELRGVPLRLEIGPRDLADGVVTVANRLAVGRKQTLPLESMPGHLPDLLADFAAALYDRALAFREERTGIVDDWSDFARGVDTGWVRTLHCGRPACEAEIKAETSATPRCVPLEAPDESGRCVRCGRPSAYGK